ncbi:Methyltransferase domain-containing protein [Tardiphaga sp. OK246]|uniref:class I SAM-dependent methyltransferase n=1 Tax=Tardiphaga sp. OK246 TaxID=1855307 RepID=UPI000B758956|nr:class I SAM-dependent methyltransferase [Tardiphaga sp. OK246]SNT63945.1 Methyltransferase domain-containing protein [Tardiphaga sp. OK246]
MIAHCRSCGAPLTQTVCNLGLSPISNAFIKPEDTGAGEMYFPLKACACENCWLVQLESGPSSDAHFHDDYLYFSSFSASWLDHAHRYVEAVTARLKLTSSSKVVEVASNDGYLLQYFVKAGIPALGIEPTRSTAAAARLKGVETREMFFGRETARVIADSGWTVDLLLGNNVLAHVPDINDFVAGMPIVLKPNGIVTLEFPHLLNLIAENQFDTIYHEHYSYLSMIALTPIFARHGLRVFDIEQLSTHGGSLRVYLCHTAASYLQTPTVQRILNAEQTAGLDTPQRFASFAKGVTATKRQLLTFLIDAKERGKSIAGYGAAAKGNTLLNYCGIRSDMIDFVVDKNPAKQGRLLPGSRIPVRSPAEVGLSRPDYLLILPWNIQDEVMADMADIRTWGGQFVVPIPTLRVIS